MTCTVCSRSDAPAGSCPDCGFVNVPIVNDEGPETPTEMWLPPIPDFGAKFKANPPSNKWRGDDDE